jgi:hypothetical protein
MGSKIQSWQVLKILAFFAILASESCENVR